MTTQRIPILAAVMALLLALPAGLSASDRPQHPKRATHTTLRVSNTNTQPVFAVLIDARRDGWAQWPLGMIEAGATRTFTVAPDVLGMPNVRIVASAFSNWKEYQSKPLTLARGRHLDLTLRDPEPRSALASR